MALMSASFNLLTDLSQPTCIAETLIGTGDIARRSVRLAVVELPKQQGEPWFVGHLVFVDVNLQALREVPGEVAQSGSNAGSG